MTNSRLASKQHPTKTHIAECIADGPVFRSRSTKNHFLNDILPKCSLGLFSLNRTTNAFRRRNILINKCRVPKFNQIFFRLYILHGVSFISKSILLINYHLGQRFAIEHIVLFTFVVCLLKI